MNERWRGTIRWRGGSIPYVRAARATSLILDAIADLQVRRVALPALYCMDTADVLSDAGLDIRWYDLKPDLGAERQSLDLAANDGAAVVWFHPFGFYRPPPADLASPIIVDACHAFRTCAAMEFPIVGAVTIFNLRKEFGLRNGALAVGAPASGVAQRSTRYVDRRLAAIAGKACLGRSDALRALLADLGPKAPSCSAIEIPTFLPLLSAARDDVIRRCRAQGFDAWRWLKPPPQAALERCLTVARLRQHLLLVRPPAPERLGELLAIVRPDTLLDWPAL